MPLIFVGVGCRDCGCRRTFRSVGEVLAQACKSKDGSRASAEKLRAELRAAGASCTVQRN